MTRACLILPLVWLLAIQAAAQEVAQTLHTTTSRNGWVAAPRASETVLRSRIDQAMRIVANAAAAGDPELQAHALLDLSNAQEEKGDLENAVRNGMRAIGLTHGKDVLLHRAAMLHLAGMHLSADHPDRTLEILGEIGTIPKHDRADNATYMRLEAQAKSRVLSPSAMIQYLNGAIGDVVKSDDPTLQAELLSLMASAETRQGGIERAIELEEQVMRIAVAQGNTTQAGISANNLAELLQSTARSAEVPELYQRAMILLDDVPVLKLNTMINAGVDRALRGEHARGYALLQEAHALSETLDHSAGVILVERTIAALLLHQGEVDRAFIQATNALGSATVAKNDREQARTCELLASISEQQGDLIVARNFKKEAKEHALRAETKAQEAGRIHDAELARWQRMEREQLELMNRDQAHRSEVRQLALDAENKEKQLALIKAEMQLEESGRREESMAREQAQQALALTNATLDGERNQHMIKDLENTRLLQSMSMDRMSMERKQGERDVELLEQRNEVAEARTKAVEMERAGERTMKRFSFAGAMLMLAVAIYMAWAWYMQRRKKRTILAQKQEIERFNRELADKNHDIESSLRVACTIQSTIVPQEADLRAIMPDSFLHYSPLASVSGDLPFVKRIGNTLYLAAIDCTGHGVPAAMMTFIAYYGLQDLLTTQSHLGCGEILDRLHVHVERTMRSRSAEGAYSDGFDIGLCAIDLVSGHCAFAGAQLPLVVVSHGEVSRFKGDILPLGDAHFRREQGYREQTVQLVPGDAVYLFSDGLTHQFGGINGKQKFSQKRLLELIGAGAENRMEQNKEQIRTKLEEWQGDVPQTDDILLIGLRFAA